MLRERAVERAHPVRERAPAQDTDSFARELVGELRRQTRLADACVADDRHEVRPTVGDDTVEDSVKHRDFVHAPEHRRGARGTLAGCRSRGDGEPRAHRLGLPLHRERVHLAVLEQGACRAVGSFADEDAVRRCRSLEPGRGVDDVTGDYPLAAIGVRSDGDDRFARVHREPHLECELGVAGIQLVDGGAHSERRAHGALRVVTVGDGRAEDGHDCVADELLDRAAEALDLGPDAGVVRPQDRADVLRIEPFRTSGEPDEVDEEDADDLPLFAHADGAVGERRGAGVAETGAVGIVAAAGGTEEHAQSVWRAGGRRRPFRAVSSSFAALE